MRKFPGDCCQNMNIDVVIVLQSFSCLWLFETPWTAAHQASCPSPSSGTCSNSCPLSQWKWKWSHAVVSDFLQPHGRSPTRLLRIFQARILEWVAISFSRRSSWPRDWTQVSDIVGRCFIIWATREAIESVMPSKHLVLCHPLLLLPSVFPSIRIFSNESVLCIRWPKYWSFSFSINPSNEYSGLISFRIGWFELLAVHGTLKSLF